MQHGVGKLSKRVTTLVQTSPWSDSAIERYELSKFRDSNPFGSDLVALIRFCSREIWALKVPGLQPGTVSGLQLWGSREKKPFGCGLRGVTQKILYGGRWWLPPSPGRGESCVSKCPWLVPTPKGVPECELTLLWLVYGCKFKLDNLVPLPSLILELLARPSTPL